MAEHDIGSLVVMKPGEEASLVGIITERGTLLKSHIPFIIMIYIYTQSHRYTFMFTRITFDRLLRLFEKNYFARKIIQVDKS